MQTSFFDLDDRYRQLSLSGDPLERLSRAIDWEMFRPLLLRVDEKSRKSNAGRRPTRIKGNQRGQVQFNDDPSMPRRNRIHLSGMPLHIVQRGHNRDACFFGEEDYLAYQHWLHEALQENDCVLHAYVLMTNHMHLLITPERAESVSRFIMALGRRYVQYINKTQGLRWHRHAVGQPLQILTH